MKRQSLLKRIFRAAKFASYYLSDPGALEKYLIRGSSSTGRTVDEEDALDITSIWAGVTIVVKIFASLPLILYRRSGDSRSRAVNHPLYKILHVKANSEMPAFWFKEIMQGHLVRYGSCYAEIVRSGDSAIKELWPLLPYKMRPYRLDNGKLIFEYALPDGTTRPMAQENVFRVVGFSTDGLTGRRPVKQNQQSLAIGLSADEYAARYFENDASPGGAVEHPGKMSDVAYKRLYDSWEAAHQPLAKKHRFDILEEGAKWHEVTANAGDAQLLETRNHQVLESARMLDLPPHFLANLDRATFSNIEHQSLEYLIFKLRPGLIRWEQFADIQLLNDQEQNVYYFEHLVDALLRADTESRFKAYRIGREIGIYSANDVLKMENRNPREGGDIYHIPLNWVAEGEEKELPEPGQEPVEPDPEENKIQRENRALRSAATRYRIAKSYEPIFVDVAGRIIRKEIADIRKATKEYLIKRDILEFDVWMDKYYDKLPKYIQTRISPVFYSLAEAVKGEIAEELNLSDPLTPEDEDFVKKYVDAAIVRHINNSKNQISSVMEQGIEEGGDLIDLLENRFEDWIEKRPGKIALSESVRGSNALAKAMYVLAGVTVIRWVSGGPQSCPFCQSMDGVTVSVEKTFVLQDKGLEVDGEKMEVYSAIGHPPLHGGCVCQIAVG